ncbi:uncharacterized protein LOC122257383 [Penaeus japonicus]|uniref:uncharacterized protein LOC122257383 n=1 Tax=Penaeus japonicus TaxID=27405 RepID=UPI001C717095|nr:uncharacterized protein LOC122257383 [Penaeus japonicus]
MTDGIIQESPRPILSADDIVICGDAREEVETNLERWQHALEKQDMRNKTYYMCVNERDGRNAVQMQGTEAKKADDLKYLGSTVQNDGGCDREAEREEENTSGVEWPKKISVGSDL